MFFRMTEIRDTDMAKIYKFTWKMEIFPLKIMEGNQIPFQESLIATKPTELDDALMNSLFEKVSFIGGSLKFKEI